MKNLKFLLGLPLLYACNNPVDEDKILTSKAVAFSAPFNLEQEAKEQDLYASSDYLNSFKRGIYHLEDNRDVYFGRANQDGGLFCQLSYYDNSNFENDMIFYDFDCDGLLNSTAAGTSVVIFTYWYDLRILEHQRKYKDLIERIATFGERP
jgi:hypothetical protein